MYTLVIPFYRCFTYNLALIGQVVSEQKMFDYHSNIRVYRPRVGTDEPLGCNLLFSQSLIFSPTAHFLQNFPFK